MTAKHYIKSFLLLIICGLMIGCGKEEVKKGSIYGVVTDFSTSEPVGGANVQLRPSGETTLTGSDGMFEILDVPNGNYSITVSKVGYTDLVDDYVITVKDGKKMRRDVQIKPLPASLHIYDNDSHEISELDFGADSGMTHKTFNIFNGGGKEINFSVKKSVDWISEISPSTGTIGVGVTYPVVVTINREKLAAGDNTTILLITSSAEGGKELLIKAKKNVELPKVNIIEAVAIDSVSYRIKCEVLDDGGLKVTERGICWSTIGDPTLDDDTIRHKKGGVGQYIILMEHLTMATHYYVRAYAQNEFGTSLSEVLEFNTEAIVTLPAVSTTEVSNVTASSAVCKGNVTDDGGTDLIERGVCWGTSANPTTSGQHQAASQATTGAFIVSVTGLEPNTTYHVRAYAKNSRGISYGEELAFTTTKGLPEVTTTSVSSITATTAKGSGTVTDQGGSAVTERGVCWSTESNPTINDNHAHSGTGTGNFTVNVTGLVSGTKYYVRAYATNTYGTAYGEPKEFTTVCSISVSSDPIDGGSVTGEGSYQPGLSCTITATPAAFYTFLNWTEDGSVVSSDPCFVFTVDANHSFVAHFKPYNTIKTLSNPSEGGFTSGGGRYQDGQQCIVTATSNAGYSFVGWTENGALVSMSPSYSFTVESDRTLEANFSPIGVVDGVFTVGPNNTDKVYFSQGNLQYIGSSGTWKFADHQWDMIGTSQDNDLQETTRDLFGWGTSGYDHGATCYAPWSISDKNSYYHAYGGVGYSLSDLTGNADWGYNVISNGGDANNIWHTLAKEEWNYVLYTRNTKSGFRFVKAQVNNVNGLILFPDDWNENTYFFSGINAISTDFNNNIVSVSDWNVLETLGTVFLPASGERAVWTVNNVGSDGYYWSETPISEIGANALHFNSADMDCIEDNRSYGRSVRLVRPAQ